MWSLHNVNIILFEIRTQAVYTIITIFVTQRSIYLLKRNKSHISNRYLWIVGAILIHSFFAFSNFPIMNMNYFYNPNTFTVFFKRQNKNVSTCAEILFTKEIMGEKKVFWPTTLGGPVPHSEGKLCCRRAKVLPILCSCEAWPVSVLPRRERLKEVVTIAHSSVFTSITSFYFPLLGGLLFSFLRYV